MRRVTGTSLRLRPGSAFALAPRASSLALRRCRVFGRRGQGREHSRRKRRSRVGLFTSEALAVQGLDGLPFPPQLAVAGADVEDFVPEASQVTLGERKLALGVVTMEQVEAVNAAGDA